MTPINERDVIVVGGGLAGLAAGATAAAGGAGTLVLEAHLPGGRARTTKQHGFIFNMGAHALSLGGPGMHALRALGVSPVGAPPPLARYRLWLGGEGHLLPSGPGTLLRTRALPARGKAQFAALLGRLPRTGPRRLEGLSVDEWLAMQDLRADVDTVVRAVVRLATYASDFRTFAADAAVRQLQAAAKGGVIYLHGGWAQLVESLASLVEVREHAPVRRVEPVAGRFEVETDDATFVARSVIVALASPEAARALLPAPPAWRELGDAVTAACLDVGVSRVPDPGYVLGADEPVYATTQSPPARQAPPGSAVVSVIRYGATEAAADRPLLERHLTRAGVVEGDVVTERFLACMTVCGAAPVAVAGGLPGRPPVNATGAGGVYLAGDWVGRDGLIGDAALASGHAAGRAALAHVGRASPVAA